MQMHKKELTSPTLLLLLSIPLGYVAICGQQQHRGKAPGELDRFFHPHLSLHPLFASSPFLTAIRWLPVSRQMQKEGGGGYWAHLYLPPSREGGAETPSADNRASSSQKQNPILPPTTPLTQFLCPPHPPRRLRVLQNPFKKQGSWMVTSPFGEHTVAFRARLLETARCLM